MSLIHAHTLKPAIHPLALAGFSDIYGFFVGLNETFHIVFFFLDIIWILRSLLFCYASP